MIDLVPDQEVCKEFHVTPMTLWRWDRDPAKIALGWPEKVKVGSRNFRVRLRLEAHKANLVQLAERAAEVAST